MDIIKDRLEELNRIAEEYPRRIPIEVAAHFLDMNAEGLRAAIMRGTAPFGFGYQKGDGKYRVFVIPTGPFYLWYTKMNAERMVRDETL